MSKLTVSETYVLDQDMGAIVDSESWDFADFHDASYAAWQDAIDTMDSRAAFAIMQKWFKHDGSESFSVSINNNHNGSVTYQYAL